MNILLAVDTSESARTAASAVVSQFAGRAHHVRLLHVTEWDSQMPLSLQFAQGPAGAKAVIEFEQKLVQHAQSYLDELASTLRQAGLTVTVDVRPEADAKSVILAVASSWPADLIVMGSHGRTGFDRLLLGSVSEDVVHRAPCSVEVVRKTQATAA